MRDIPGKSDSEMEKGERQTFSRDERLCKNSLFEELFEKGNSFHNPLFRVVWMILSDPLSSPARIAISVPKKGFRHATDRNLIKRRIRESYRRRKQTLQSLLRKKDINIAFMIIYRGSRIEDFSSIDRSVKEVIEKLCKSAESIHVKS